MNVRSNCDQRGREGLFSHVETRMTPNEAGCCVTVR